MHLDLTQGDIKSHIKTVAVPASVGFFSIRCTTSPTPILLG